MNPLAVAANPPNVLLIEADQWHHALLSCFGSDRVATPHLDALARAGAVFTRAVCQHPMCMPSRASMLSGQYPSTNKQWGFSGLCDARTPWMHRAFRAAGYKTGASGKFHVACIGEPQWSEFDFAAPTLPEEENLAIPSGNHYRAYCEKVGEVWPSDQNHGHVPNGPKHQGSPWKISSKAPRDKNFHFTSAWESETSEEHSLETYTTDRFLNFLDAHGQNPWWFWLSYDRPHTPTTLPTRLFATVAERAKTLELPPAPTLEQVKKWPRSMFEALGQRTSIWQMNEADFKFILASYYVLIEWIDAEIGRAVAGLEARGLGGRTHLVFTADHGEQAGWGGTWEKALRATSEAIVRTPLVFRVAPDVSAARGQTRHEPVELVDIFPTICTLAGVPQPERIEGRDLSSALLHGENLDANRAVVCETFTRKSVGKGDWRLVFDSRHEAECALFHLARDPDGYENRYDEAGLQATRVSLKGELLRFECARHFGPFDARDVRRFERGFDPNDAHTSVIGGVSGAFPVQPFRNGVFFGGEGHSVFARFDGPSVEFLPLKKAGYPSPDDLTSLPDDTLEALLDSAIRYLMSAHAPVGVFAELPSFGEKAPAECVEKFFLAGAQ